MKYRNYLTKKYTGYLLILMGALLLLGSYMVGIKSAFSPASKYSDILSIVLSIGGVVLIAYGAYIVNKIGWQRENSGRRLYHYRGRYR